MRFQLALIRAAIPFARPGMRPERAAPASFVGNSAQEPSSGETSAISSAGPMTSTSAPRTSSGVRMTRSSAPSAPAFGSAGRREWSCYGSRRTPVPARVRPARELAPRLLLVDVPRPPIDSHRPSCPTSKLRIRIPFHSGDCRYDLTAAFGRRAITECMQNQTADAAIGVRVHLQEPVPHFGDVGLHFARTQIEQGAPSHAGTLIPASAERVSNEKFVHFSMHPLQRLSQVRRRSFSRHTRRGLQPLQGDARIVGARLQGTVTPARGTPPGPSYRLSASSY